MGKELFQIVFRGELASGFTREEVKSNLQQLFRCETATVERFFTSASVVIKHSLDATTADRYRGILEKTGALCVLEAMPSAPATVPTPTPPPNAISPPAEINCPACGLYQPSGLSCGSCGVIYTKYLQSQERKKEAATLGVSVAELRRRQTVPEGGSAPVATGWAAHFAQHQEQAFILKAMVMIIAIVSLRQFLSGGLLFLAFLLFPVVFLLYIRMKAADSDQNPTEVLAQHITLMPVMYAEGEQRNEEVPWVTYALIVLNVAIFYGIEIHLDEQVLSNFLFLPEQPNFWNVPVSAVTAIFLHAGNGHLWGNMIFLWAVGSVVERRIGPQRFLVFYLLCGLVAGLFGALAYWLFLGRTLHGLGASGAIAGVMGIFAVRCYFKSMVFPLPILGIFSLILPISLKVRLNSLVIIGLFFLADLSGGVAQASGTSASHTGHWIHIGGMAAGVALALFFRLGVEAVEERHLELGSTAVGGSSKVNLETGEESLRLVLRNNPDNTEALLLLAQLVSRHTPSDEGREFYSRAIALLATSRPKEAAKAYREFFNKYFAAVAPALQYRLAVTYYQECDLEMTSRTLELVVKDQQAPPSIREKAMFQYARVLDELGLTQAAADNYSAFVDAFPASPNLAKAQARRAALC